VGGSGDPLVVMNVVAQAIATKKLPLTPPQYPLLRSSSGSGGGFKWKDNGTPDSATLTQVCKVLGFSTAVASTCLDNERSSRYPAGKCNFHSPHNNSLSRFTGAGFTSTTAEPKYGLTWIASITCRHRLSACSDGWDNDGDGLVDFPADPGCASPNDDDERKHDSGCTSATDPSEKEECRDGIDNDKDGKTDFPDDFSCSSLSDNDESNPKAKCQDGKDNDGDGLVDKADPGCASPQDNDESNSSVRGMIAPQPLAPEAVPGITLSRSGSPVALKSEGSVNGVRPVVDCVERAEGGGYLAYFGYINDSGRELRIEIGDNNRIGASNSDAGQPTRFSNGQIRNAIRVQFEDAVSWKLAGVEAIATARSVSCSECQPKGCKITCQAKFNLKRITDIEQAIEYHQQITRRLLRLADGGTFSRMVTWQRTIRSARDQSQALVSQAAVALNELRSFDWERCESAQCGTRETGEIVSRIEALLNDLDAIQLSLAESLSDRPEPTKSEAAKALADGEVAYRYTVALLGEIPRVGVEAGCKLN
ncbi:MAG: hypothetical protein ACK5Y6_09915, partial [Pseudomonadota bacterium]